MSSGQATSLGNDMDEEFLRGLESILGPMREAGASQEELKIVTARARQFYLSRRQPPPAQVDGVTETTSQQTSQLTDGQTHDASNTDQSRGRMLAPDEPTDDQPRYPLSFDELAEMIATGAHIPGIREIPDKINDESPSEPVLAKQHVRKPWEGAPQAHEGGQSLSALLGQRNEDRMHE